MKTYVATPAQAWEKSMGELGRKFLAAASNEPSKRWLNRETLPLPEKNGDADTLSGPHTVNKLSTLLTILLNKVESPL